MEPMPSPTELSSRVPTPAERRRAMARGRAERSRAAHALFSGLKSWISELTATRQRIVVPPRGDMRIIACSDC